MKTQTQGHDGRSRRRPLISTRSLGAAVALSAVGVGGAAAFGAGAAQATQTRYPYADQCLQMGSNAFGKEIAISTESSHHVQNWVQAYSRCTGGTQGGYGCETQFWSNHVLGTDLTNYRGAGKYFCDTYASKPGAWIDSEVFYGGGGQIFAQPVMRLYKKLNTVAHWVAGSSSNNF